jgi:hypothetical protein
MSDMDDDELNEKLDQMMNLYYEIKEEIRKRDPHTYEHWKAGGFLVDPYIHSMYSNIKQAVESVNYDE